MAIPEADSLRFPECFHNPSRFACPWRRPRPIERRPLPTRIFVCLCSSPSRLRVSTVQLVQSPTASSQVLFQHPNQLTLVDWFRQVLVAPAIETCLGKFLSCFESQQDYRDSFGAFIFLQCFANFQPAHPRHH